MTPKNNRSIYGLVVNVFRDVVDDLEKWIGIFNSPKVDELIDKWNDLGLASEYVMGGGRKSGKTFSAYILSVLGCLSIDNSILLVDRMLSKKRIDSMEQINFIIFKLLNVGAAIKSINKTEFKITFNNDSIILFRSVYDPNGLIQMTGIPRKDYTLAFLINEECNAYEQAWFNIASEAVVAKKQIKFRIFNTDTVRQHIVNRLQEAMPQDEHVMVSKGYQKEKIHEEIKYLNSKGKEVVDNHITKYYRVNYRVALKVLPKAEVVTINRNYDEDPVRGRVARDGLNGTEGKRLYYNLADRHFLNSKDLDDYSRFERLPYMLFKKYRAGIDEGYSKDKFALTFWGITHHNRAIRLEKLVITPSGQKDLNINELSKSAVERLILWSQTYENMLFVPVNIRVEWAGNGVAIKQEMERLLYNTKINYTIDKAKKSIQSRVKKVVQSNIERQPELEARAAIKNLLLGRNQMIFWNADGESYNEYFSRARDDEGIIIDGDDHEGDADDYALIPEYEEMLEKPPEITFKEELDKIIKMRRIRSCSQIGGIVYV